MILYYGYVLWVLKFKKSKKPKVDSDKLVHLSTKDNEQADLEDLLDQVKEAENNSKLFEAFKKDKRKQEDSESKSKKLQVIRDEDLTDQTETDADS